MNISNELKEKVERLLRNNEELKRGALEGNADAIRKIGNLSQNGIQAKEITEAYENNTIEQLYKKAKNILELQDVYEKLCDAYYNREEDENEEER